MKDQKSCKCTLTVCKGCKKCTAQGHVCASCSHGFGCGACTKCVGKCPCSCGCKELKK